MGAPHSRPDLLGPSRSAPYPPPGEAIIFTPPESYLIDFSAVREWLRCPRESANRCHENLCTIGFAGMRRAYQGC
jgi:hypothetical protein